MAREDDLVSRVRATLGHVPKVEEKKMFGHLAFMVRGKLCIGVRSERIMCRIDPTIHDAAVEREGCETVVMRGSEYRGYVYVDAESIRADDALQYWVDLALEYNKAIA